jgi:DNA-binding CsgD family transcriptional regulator
MNTALPSSHLESRYLTPDQAQALLRLLEAAPEVQRRNQFFIWCITHVQSLLPHQLAVCGAYSRTDRVLVYEAFHSVHLPADLLAAVTEPHSLLMAALSRRWVEGAGRAYQLVLSSDITATTLPAAALLAQRGLCQLVVHAVARPGRLHEIESLFVLAGPVLAPPPPRNGEAAAQMQMAGATPVQLLDLLLSPLHLTYARVQNQEREMGVHGNYGSYGTQGARGVHGANVAANAPASSRSQAPPITQREVQILRGVREGKTNQQIGEQLAISALTVKNHVQKILRKLGAANRAQAVAMAMALNLLQAGPDHGLPSSDHHSA